MEDQWPQSIAILDNLNEKQLLAKILILRPTVAPSIRQMQRIKSGSNFRMEKFSEGELKISIRNALQPQENIHSDINVLLKQVLWMMVIMM